MAKNLVIVESPAKAKTLKKFLGSSYKIEASIGHVRDLPKSEFGIDVENDFEPKYITIRGKGELLAKLRKEVKNADNIYLATDPDREGEAISWHLYHALRLENKNAKRIIFNEITKTAVKKSIKEAREIDMHLVNAQQARRLLDRIVGYKISPLLWKKVKKGLSAGRVQSTALKLIYDREEEIENFEPQEYWSIEASLSGKSQEEFIAKFSGTLENKMDLNTQEEVESVLDAIKSQAFSVIDVKKGKREKKPFPPFTTSTLQQEASKNLGFAASKTMLTAQQLYEGVDIKGRGTIALISYMRTDSVRISDEAFEEAKKYVIETHGESFASPIKVEYKSKKGSQDAHEAVRPTNTEITPLSIKDLVSRDQYRLYKLIWERFVASQMMPAIYDTLSIKIAVNGYLFRTSGSIVSFEGYLREYKEKKEEGKENNNMPELQVGEDLNLLDIKGNQHFTQAPPHFNEAMLVKHLEEIGVGRPSTYAPTLTTIVARGYVTKENKSFYPTELGEIVNDIMKNNFSDIVDTNFTAKVEDDLDKVSEGGVQWKDLIRHFYFPFEKEVLDAEERIGSIEIKDEETDVLCENCGKNMIIKYGRYGKFLACPGFPECRMTKPLFEKADANCPLCDGEVLIKKSKKGRRYYGCSNNPECEFMSWSKPTGEKCPKCGDILVEKGTKKKNIACVNNQCGYFIEKPDDTE